MEKQMNRKSMQKTGFVVLLIDFMVYLGVAMQNYSSYVLTDIAKISAGTVGTIMAVGNYACCIVCFFVGMAMTNTHTKMGQYRPWLLWTYIASSVGSLLLIFHTDHKGIGVAIGAVAFFLFMLGLLLQGTAKFGLYMKLAGDNNEARTLYASRSFSGLYIGVLVSGAAMVPLVGLFGGDNEAVGWWIVQGIFVVITMAGALLLMKITKVADTTIRDSSGGISMWEQVKSLFANRSGITVWLADVFRYMGVFALQALVVYHFTYVIGSLKLTSVALVVTGISSFIGTIIAPNVTEKVGGRKKMAIIAAIAMVIVLAFMSFSPTSMSTVGFLIPYAIMYFFRGMVEAVVVPLYTDAGEYWIHKTGKDTRPFLVASQNAGIAFGGGLAGMVVGQVLTAINYTAGESLSAAASSTLCMWTSLVPMIGMILFVICLLIHNVSDKKVEEYIRENSKAGY